MPERGPQPCVILCPSNAYPFRGWTQRRPRWDTPYNHILDGRQTPIRCRKVREGSAFPQWHSAPGDGCFRVRLREFLVRLKTKRRPLIDRARAGTGEREG